MQQAGDGSGPCTCTDDKAAAEDGEKGRCRSNPMKPLASSALTVCGLDELERYSAWGVSHVLSTLDPDGRVFRRARLALTQFR
jgi:hypothetical protein